MKDRKSETIKQPALIAALKDAGYTIGRFARLAGGRTLEVHLKPATLRGKDGNFRALETCAALDLQGQCRRYAAVPHPILILRVVLPDASQPDKSETAPNA